MLLNAFALYFDAVSVFSTGNQLIQSLVEICSSGHVIENLAIMGHSGYQGFFVKNYAGFYRDEYKMTESGSKFIWHSDAASISELENLIKIGKIKFSKQGIIILMGCHTAYGENNIALDMSLATDRSVIGTDQKIDIYNTSDFGEEMYGEQKKTFFAYIPTPKNIIKYNLCSDTITVSEAVRRVKYKQYILSSQDQ